MIPDVSSVVRKRYRMRRTLRMAALVLFLVYFVATVQMVASWILYSSLENLWRGVLYWSGFAAGAVLLCATERRLIRWLLPLPRALCPGCGYDVAGLTGGQCSECGLSLPAELTTGSGR